MLTFDLAPDPPTRKDFPPPGFSYLDIQRIRDLVLPRANLVRGGRFFYGTMNGYLQCVERHTRLKLWMICHRTNTYWSDSTREKLAKLLDVPPDSLKARELPLMTRAAERFNHRAQDFVHDVFQDAVATELRGKRLNDKEYNEWLALLLGCSPRTVYNLRNGTANPSQTLVAEIANHFSKRMSDFYRA